MFKNTKYIRKLSQWEKIDIFKFLESELESCFMTTPQLRYYLIIFYLFMYPCTCVSASFTVCANLSAGYFTPDKSPIQRRHRRSQGILAFAFFRSGLWGSTFSGILSGRWHRATSRPFHVFSLFLFEIKFIVLSSSAREHHGQMRFSKWGSRNVIEFWCLLFVR